MSLLVDFIVGIVAILFCASFYFKRRKRNGYLPLPPGPPKLPLLGNFLDMPNSYPWVTYDKWCREYNSDIIHLNALGASFIVINTTEAANELLERRSTIYSSRPSSPMIVGLMGWDWNMSYLPYGEAWRRGRRLFHQEFHPAAAMRFRPLELRAAQALVRSLLNDPENFTAHVHHLSGKIVLSIAYGIDVQDKNDPYIEIAEAANGPFIAAAAPGTYYVDYLPLLKYVPEWLPGAGFKKKAKVWRSLARRMIEVPFDEAKKKFTAGVESPSFVSYCLEKIHGSQDVGAQEYTIQNTAGTMFSAGSETTSVAMETFILAMLLHPEVQAKAQKELDDVVGKNRLPDFSYEHSLPYITSIVKEVLRWNTVVPLALPHVLEVDDVYNGWWMPAGSIVIPNTWAMLYNEKDYKNPTAFNPDRYLKDGREDPSIKDPTKPAFGFGRRTCPGRYMASSTLWISIASVLASFDITKVVDENGNVIEAYGEFTSGLTSSPKPFKAAFRPRSKEIEALIQSTTNDASMPNAF